VGKFSLLSFLIIILAFANNYCFAQGSAAGCLYNNVVYTSAHPTSDRFDYVGPKTQLSSNYCSWAPSISSPICEICIGGFNTPGNCKAGGSYLGVKGTFTMVECPIDKNYFFLRFGILISIISVRKLNSKKPMLSKI